MLDKAKIWTAKLLRVALTNWLFMPVLVRIHLLEIAKWRCQDEPSWRARTERVRNASRKLNDTFGTNFGLPVVLDEPDECAECHAHTFVIVVPENFCDDCFMQLAHRLVERIKGEVQLRRGSAKQSPVQIYSLNGRIPG